MRTILIALLMTLATQSWAQDGERVSEKLAHEVMLNGEIINTYNQSEYWVYYNVRYKKNLYSCAVGNISKPLDLCKKVSFKGD